MQKYGNSGKYDVLEKFFVHQTGRCFSGKEKNFWMFYLEYFPKYWYKIMEI